MCTFDHLFLALHPLQQESDPFPLWVWAMLTFADDLKAEQMKGMFPTMPHEKKSVFDPEKHMQKFDELPWEPMYDERHVLLEGIRGKTGATEIGSDGEEIGADLIEMQPGSAFPLHTHPGDHILYAVSGRGTVTIDGKVRLFEKHTTFYIAGSHPHNVGTYAEDMEPFVLLAVGHPKKHVSAHDRMKIVQDEHDFSI